MMKKRLLCIAAAVLMVLAAVFAFGCEKQFPSEQEVLKSHLDKYCRENGEKIIEKYKNYFSCAQCSALVSVPDCIRTGWPSLAGLVT